MRAYEASDVDMLIALTTCADRVSTTTRFDNAVFPWFGLPVAMAQRVVR